MVSPQIKSWADFSWENVGGEEARIWFWTGLKRNRLYWMYLDLWSNFMVIVEAKVLFMKRGGKFSLKRVSNEVKCWV